MDIQCWISRNLLEGLYGRGLDYLLKIQRYISEEQIATQKAGSNRLALVHGTRRRPLDVLCYGYWMPSLPFFGKITFSFKGLKSSKVLFEGTQGTLLDLYHGTYPFVTSSSTLGASAATSCGIGPSFAKIVGISRAYATHESERVLFLELHDEQGDRLQAVGREFAELTNRRRRCGWLDLVSLKYAIRTNGITSLTLTKLDVFSVVLVR